MVYPCGTEIGLEIYKAISKSAYYEIYGGSSSYDHGRFIFNKHIDNLPFICDDSTRDNIIEFNEIIKKYAFDFIYPAMDGVVTVFSKYKDCLEPIVIAPEYDTSAITRSKKKTYQLFKDIIPIPRLYESIEQIDQFPVFIKPDIGQGSVGTSKIDSKEELSSIKKNDSQLIMEYLPGKEYTIDCFTNQDGKLIFFQGRERKRTRNGISVNTILCDRKEFAVFAEKINSTLGQKGGWFFQLKEDRNGKLKLLEISSRIAGASAIQRCKGVNLPLLTVNIFNEISVEDVIINNYYLELDRALNNCYKIDLSYDEIYVDYDDTLIIDGKVNTQLIKFIYQSINNNKKIVLLTKHDGNLEDELDKYRIRNIFDKIVHIERNDDKYRYVLHKNAIFIDDSYGERKNISKKCNIPVFDTAMIECLMEE